MDKSTIFTTNIEELLEYISRDDNGESEASVSLNPSFSWAKFILTDDMANENKQRIPRQEFSNLIKTGIHAPIKMEAGDPLGDHAQSTPLGVITHLKETGNKVEGIAALWTRERESDVQSLKEMYKTGRLPQLSWEVMYEDSKVGEDGVEDLIGTALRAVTVVGVPAYAGRTPIVALASTQEPNTNLEELNVDELEQAKARITELEKLLADKDTEINTTKAEVDTLREFKSNIEKEQADAEKLTTIKQKFLEAGIKKEDTFFAEKKELLLGLSDNALDFMIQEMVSFSSADNKNQSTSSIPRIPTDPEDVTDDPKKLAEELRKRHTSK